MSPGLPTRETHSIHYHTTNGKTLTYQLENVANYGISLSPLSSETETVIAETVLTEPHVAPTVERTTPLQPSHLQSKIEERMLCCLHSSKAYLSKDINDRDYYVPTSTARHENLRTVHPNASCFHKNVSRDIAVPNNKNREIYENKTGNSTNEGLEQEYSEDVFAYGDAEGLDEIVDEKFAVMEEFATVLEESESVFEGVENYTEELGDYVVTDEEVLQVIEQEHLLESANLKYQTETVLYDHDNAESSMEKFEDRSSLMVAARTVERIELDGEHADTVDETSGVKTHIEPDEIDYEMEDDEPKEGEVYFEESDDDPEMREITYLKFDEDGLTDFPMFEREQPSENYKSKSYLESLEEEDEEEEEEDEGVDERTGLELKMCLDPIQKDGQEVVTVEKMDTDLLKMKSQDIEHPETECYNSEEHAVTIGYIHELERSLSPETASDVFESLTDERLPSQSTTDDLQENNFCERIGDFDEHNNYGLLQDQFEKSLSVFDKLTSAILHSENALYDDVTEGAGVFDQEDDSLESSDKHLLLDRFAKPTSSYQNPVVTPADTELIDLVRNYVNLVINAPIKILHSNTSEETLEDVTREERSCENHVITEVFLTDKEEDATNSTLYDKEEVDVNEAKEKLENRELIDRKSLDDVLSDDELNTSENRFDDDADGNLVRSIVDDVISRAFEKVEKLLGEPEISTLRHVDFQNELPVDGSNTPDSSDDSEESFITVIFNPFSLDDIANTTVPTSVRSEESTELNGEQNVEFPPNESEMETDDSVEQNEHEIIGQYPKLSSAVEEEMLAKLGTEEKQDDVTAEHPVEKNVCIRLVIKENSGNFLDSSLDVKTDFEEPESRKFTSMDNICLEDPENQYSGEPVPSIERDFETTKDRLKSVIPTKSLCTVEPWSSITVKRASREGSPDLYPEQIAPSNESDNTTSEMNFACDSAAVSLESVSCIAQPVRNFENYEEPALTNSSLDSPLTEAASSLFENNLEKGVEDATAELETDFTLDYHVLAFYVHEESEDDRELSTPENSVRCDDGPEDILEANSGIEDNFVDDVDVHNGEHYLLTPEYKTAGDDCKEFTPKTEAPVSVSQEIEEDTINLSSELVKVQEECTDCSKNNSLHYKETQALPMENLPFCIEENGAELFDIIQQLEERNESSTITSLKFAEESVGIEVTENTLDGVAALHFEYADMKDCSKDDEDVFKVLHFVISNVDFCEIENHQVSIHSSSSLGKKENADDEKELFVLGEEESSSQQVKTNTLFGNSGRENAGQDADNDIPSTSLTQDLMLPDLDVELVQTTCVEAIASALVTQVLEDVLNAFTPGGVALRMSFKEPRSEQSLEGNSTWENILSTSSSSTASESSHYQKLQSYENDDNTKNEECYDLRHFEAFAMSLTVEIMQAVLELGKLEEDGQLAEYSDPQKRETTGSLDSIAEVVEHSKTISAVNEADYEDRTLEYGITEIGENVLLNQDFPHNLVDNWTHSLAMSITLDAVTYVVESSVFENGPKLIDYQQAPVAPFSNVTHQNDNEEIVQRSPLFSRETSHDSQTRGDANEEFLVVESLFYQERLEIFNHADYTIRAATQESTLEPVQESAAVHNQLSSSLESSAVSKHGALDMYDSSTGTFPAVEVSEQDVENSEDEAESSETSDAEDSSSYDSWCDNEEELELLEQNREENLIEDKNDVDDEAEEDGEFAADSELSAILEGSQLISSILDINRNHQTEASQERFFGDDCESQPATREKSMSTNKPDQSKKIFDDDLIVEEQEFQADEELNAVLETSALISSILKYSRDEQLLLPKETLKENDQLTTESSFSLSNPEVPLRYSDVKDSISPSQHAFHSASDDFCLQHSEITSLLSEMITLLETEENALTENNLENELIAPYIQTPNTSEELSVVKAEHGKTHEVSTTGFDRTVGETGEEITKAGISAVESINSFDCSHDVTDEVVRVRTRDVSGLEKKKNQQKFGGEQTDVDADMERVVNTVKQGEQHEKTAGVENQFSQEVGPTRMQPDSAAGEFVDELNSDPVGDRNFDVVSATRIQNEEEIMNVLDVMLTMAGKLESTLDTVSETLILAPSVCDIPESQNHCRKTEHEQEHAFSISPEKQAISGLSESSNEGSTSADSVVPVSLSLNLERPFVASSLKNKSESCHHSSCFDTPETTLLPTIETRFTLFPEDSESFCSTSAVTMTLENQSILLPHYQFPQCKQEFEDLVDQDDHVSNVPISVVPTSSEPLSAVSDAVPENSYLKDPSTTKSSFNHPEPVETSSVVEEVSYFLTTVCVAALVFVPSSESPSTPFNSDIVEDVSQHFSTVPNTEPEPDQKAVSESENNNAQH